MYTLDAMLQLFFAEMDREIAKSTQDNYHYALNSLKEYLSSDVRLKAVSRADLIHWRAGLLDHYAVATANTYIRVVRRFFKWSVEFMEDETGETLANPARKLRMLKAPDLVEPKAIDHEDVMKLIAEAYRDGNLRNQAIVMFLYATGGRVGGLIGLKMGNLELDKGRAWVVEKGNKGRYVYLPEPAIETLENYIRYHRPHLDGVDSVFISQRKTPLTRHGVWHLLRTLAKRAGVESVHNPHSFRHAFAIAYLQNGGDLSSLSRLLGHSTITITHQNYGRWAEDQLREQHARYSPFNGLSLPGENDET